MRFYENYENGSHHLMKRPANCTIFLIIVCILRKIAATQQPTLRYNKMEVVTLYPSRIVDISDHLAEGLGGWS